MGSSSIDRNMLFGVLAWQLGVVEREALMTAMYTCLSDADRPLPDVLVASGVISDDDRRWVDQAVERQLRKHDQNAAQTLADIGSVDAIYRQLRGIALSGAAQTLDSIDPVDRHAPTLAPRGTLNDDGRSHAASGDDDGIETGADRFRIVRPHARGGLGEVFVAVDEELNREVAVKQILSRHADNNVSRSRFMLEAEVTGNLEHPGVVPVYGLGSQSDGRPYYAMRFIRGESLEDAIRRYHEANDNPLRDPGQRALELRNLLSRFVAVCNTIEYAHSRGYVHRDIKPENIMLGPYGETLVVDWGLARPMEGQHDEFDADVVLESEPPPIGTPTGERLTKMGAVVGTPQFMSPEQAAGRLDLIRARSDVYSLGATLYCLLTDQPAFVAPDVRKILRDVREGRFAPPRQIDRDVPRGLEAICMKAMALVPEDRYASARALADDVEHWLADEPVVALRETAAERFQRWLRRHRTWARAAAAALIVVAAVTGIAWAREVGLRAQVQSALKQEEQARREADDARRLADRNAELARDQRERAEAHALRAEQQSVLALGTLKSVLFDIQAKLKNVPAAHTVRLSMLNTVVEGLKQVARNLETATETDHSLVRAYIDLGDVFLQVGASDGAGATVDALAMFERAHGLATTLHDADPVGSQSRIDLAAVNQRMGDVSRHRGNLADAADWYRKSLEMRDRLVSERPDDAALHRDLASSVQRLGLVNEELRDLAAAETYYRRFLDISEQLAERDPENLEDRRNLSVSYERLGDVNLRDGDAQAAEEFFAKSLEVRRMLVAASENNSPAKRDMSVTLDRLGNLALDRNDSAKAEDYFRQSLELRQALYDGDPNNVQSLRDVLVSYASLGDTALGLGNLEDALKYYQRYQGIAEKLVLGDSDNVQFVRDLATSYYRQGDVLLRAGHPFEALAFLRKYHELIKQMADSDPANVALREDLQQACATVGDLCLNLGEYAAAEIYLAENLAEARRRRDRAPDAAAGTNVLIDALVRTGDLHLRLLDLKSAERELREALTLAQRADAADGRGPASRLGLAGAESMLAQFELENRDAAKAAESVARALAHLRDVAEGSDAALAAQAAAILEEQGELTDRCETARRAAGDVDFALKQAPPLVPDLLDFAAAAQLRSGDYAAAEKTLEQLAALERRTGGHLFAAARRYAAAAAAVDLKQADEAARERRTRYLDRAMALLREADKAGAFEDALLTARLKFASDIAVLRDRDEFVELLKKIESRSGTPAPKTT